jgi:putative ABC transport system substrate-binding protein
LSLWLAATRSDEVLLRVSNWPGGNATGFAELNQEVGSKRIGIFRELLPGATRFAVLTGPNSILLPADFADLQAAASKNGLQLELIYAERALVGDFDTAFAALVQQQIEGFMADPSALLYNFRRPLTEKAARHAIPGIYWDRAIVEAGGLISYGSSVADQFRQVGIYAGRILKGEKPANLPVQQPTKFEFVINAKAAKALRLSIPPTLLALADEVIE